MPDRSWDVPGLVRQHRQGPRAGSAGSRGPASRTGSRRPPTGIAPCPTRRSYHQSSKKFGLDTVYSVSAIVACYKDNQAIPIMYERLKATFTKLNIDFEIIFVNDCSPDDTEEVIRAHLAERPAGGRHQPLAEFRLAVGVPQRHGDRLQERLRPARRRPAGPARADRAVRRALARGLRRRLRPPGQARGHPVHAVRLQGVLPGLRLFLLHPDPARRRRLLADGQARRRRRSCSSPSATCSSAACGPSPASSRPASITSGPSGCSASPPTTC